MLAAWPTPWPATRIASRPTPCVRVFEVGSRGALCTDADGLLVDLALDGAVARRWPLRATDAARDEDGRVFVLAGARLEALDPETGARAVLMDPAGSTGLAGGGSVAYVDRLAVRWLYGEGREDAPCPPEDNLDRLALDDAGAAWGVCSSGRVVGWSARDGWTTRGDPDPRLLRPSAVAVADGRLLVGTLDGAVVEVDLQRNAVAYRIETGLAAVHHLAVDPTGRHALAIDEAGSAWMWRPREALGLGRLDVEGAQVAAWTSAEVFVLAGATLETWRLERAAAPSHWQEAGGISAVARSADGRTLAIGVGPSLVVRDATTARVLHRSDLHRRVIKAIAFGPDGLIATGAVDEPHGTALLEPVTGAHAFLPDATPKIRAVAWDAAGTLFASPWSPWLDRWPGRDGPPQRAEIGARWVTLHALPDGALLGLDEDGALHRRDPDGSVARVLADVPPAGLFAMDLAGTWIALAHRRAVAIHAWPDGARRLSFEVDAPVTSLAFGDDGATLALGTLRGDVAEYDARTGALRWTAPGHRERVSAIVPDVDGGWFSAGWDGVVRRWRAP